MRKVAIAADRRLCHAGWMNRHPASIPPKTAHRYTTRVYYDDTDAGGVVYHASYLRMADRARTEALREGNASHAELIAQHGLVFLVRRAAIDYGAPARLDDLLVVATWPVAVRHASLDLRQTFWRCDEKLVEVDLTLACVRADGSAVARIPERWRAALMQLASGESA